MASDAIAGQPQHSDDALLGAQTSFLNILKSAVRATTSLKLTVALFVMSIFLIWVGTLAQVEKDMWEVIDLYFRAKLCWVDVSVFFPPTWFPSLGPLAMRVLIAFLWLAAGTLASLPCFLSKKPSTLRFVAGCTLLFLGALWAVQSAVFGGFFIFGGATVGALLLINLLAAHALRFGVKSRGIRLATGILILIIGVLLTWLVIASGHNKEGLQAVPFFTWQQLWLWCKFALVGLTAATCALLVYMIFYASHRIIELVLVGVAAIVLVPVCIWVFVAGDAAYLGDSGMRILWQLIQGGLAGVVLLVGCILLFKRRGGIVLIHAGLGLLMFGELFVSLYAVEERINIKEGEAVNYAVDIRETELAVVDPDFSASESDVIAIPQSLLLKCFQSGKAIAHPDLPFGIRVTDYVQNSDLRRAKPAESNLATKGLGLSWVIEEVRSASGASGGQVDMASAYVTLTDKESGEAMDTYLVSQLLATQGADEKVRLGDKTYDMSLRFKRTYKPYSMQLIDVRKDDYIGTSTPKNYSSDVRLFDPSRKVDREVRIWMNNPLRYAGETFYQSGYNKDPRTGTEMTTLQVVTNTGWMIPYVACMLVTTGLLAHFPVMLLRFLKRRDEALLGGENAAVAKEVTPVSPVKGKERKRRKNRGPVPEEPQAASPLGIIVPAIVVFVMVLWLGSRLRPPSLPKDGFDLAAFAKLPAVDNGRVKPIDTLVRNVLTKISDRDTFMDSDDHRQPAVRWFLDSIARPDKAEEYDVFRIHNLEVLDTLGLTRRKGFRYSLAEIRDDPEKLEEFDKHTREAGDLDAAKLSFYQRKVLEVSQRFQSYMRVSDAFSPWDLPDYPSEEELKSDRRAAVDSWVRRMISTASAAEQRMEMIQAPLVIPTLSDGAERDEDQDPRSWQAYATAYNRSFLRQSVLGEDPDEPVRAWSAMLDAYRRGEAAEFNEEVAKYLAALRANPPDEYSPLKVAVEAYFNHAAPFYHSMVLYLVAFLAAAFAWLGWSKPLNRTAFWLILLAFCLHTVALVLRMYISGRPPVTNLYSSAIFIGWCCVLAGLILEAVFRLGLGNVVAAVGGFVTLIIATFLARGSDTFTVMQAVLDTQFWLATHVVFITIGYAAVFVAGLLGIIYIIAGVAARSLTPELDKLLTRMIYGVVCFALIFSLIGTVLGGLWADDSWGRFWGWDPKENGALMIVLWTALILHARWDGMVKGRGLAVLAVGGNIVTAWSWFGVNELGVGLHSYGFTQGVLLTLGVVVAKHLGIMALGCWPRKMHPDQGDQEPVVLAQRVPDAPGQRVEKSKGRKVEESGNRRQFSDDNLPIALAPRPDETDS